MNRVRIVNNRTERKPINTLSYIESLREQGLLDQIVEVPPAISREEAARIAQAALSTDHGPSECLSDPRGLLEDALGRFDQIPERESTLDRARQLCKEHAVEGPEGQPVRFHAPLEPDLDIILVLHPNPQMVKGVDGEDYETERYMVFARSFNTVKGKCYACNNAERRGMTAKKHDCWRKKTWLDWVPFMFAWAHGIDDAEDLAKELRASWEATAEQKYDDNALVNWSRTIELPFSNDFMLNTLVGQQNAWDSLSRDENESELEISE